MGYEETKLTEALKLTDYLNKPMEAYYIGSKEVTTRFGEQAIHTFQKADGKRYDFWGIQNSQSKTGHSWQGITRFKKGFGGYEKNYIGAYDLVLSDIGYPIYGFMRKIKGLAK